MALVSNTLSEAKVSGTSKIVGPWEASHSLLAQVTTTAIVGSEEVENVETKEMETVATQVDFTCVLEDSVDNSKWNSLASFALTKTTGAVIKRVKNTEPFGQYLRMKYTIAGSNPKVAAIFTVYGH